MEPVSGHEGSSTDFTERSISCYICWVKISPVSTKAVSWKRNEKTFKRVHSAIAIMTGNKYWTIAGCRNVANSLKKKLDTVRLHALCDMIYLVSLVVTENLGYYPAVLIN